MPMRLNDEAPCGPAIAGQGMFCLTAVLRGDCKELCHFLIRSLLQFIRCGVILLLRELCEWRE
jgi:hypothetical protein